MRHRTVVFAVLMGSLCMGASTFLRAQVPPVTGTCVENCGGGSTSGTPTAGARAGAVRLARERKWYNEVHDRWVAAAKAGNNFLRDGLKAEAKGQCAAAAQDFQRELAALSVDLTSPGPITLANFTGLYMADIVHQQQGVQHARNLIALVPTSCHPAATPAAPIVPTSKSAKALPPATTRPGAVALNVSLTRIGAAAAIRGNVYMLLSDGTRVPLRSGSAIYFNSRIVTGNGGHLQILLLDETVFTLGPNADMVLDDFVYDPNTSVGALSASFAKGTFRFVTGKMTHTTPDNVRVKLPVVAVGIRGTDFEVKYEPGAAGYIDLKKGALLITPNTGAPFPMKAGEKAAIKADGTIVPPPSTRK